MDGTAQRTAPPVRRWLPLRERLLAWALRRQGRDHLPLTLRSRRIYIVPTQAGLAFGCLIAVAFIAGLNYGSGLAMLLTFWLTGFAFTAMLQTHRSLSGTQVLAADATPAFAGQPVPVHLQLASLTAGADFTCSTAVGGTLPVAVSGDDRQSGSCQLQLEFPAASRGIWRLPVLRLETRAPFGLFRTWTWLALDLRTDIYPRPAGDRPLPEAPGEQAGSSAASAGLDELTWLRPFREGDSPRQVAWKAYAREMPLLVREYRGNAQTSRDFDFDTLPDLATEERLSQLCAWTLGAAARGERFRLRLPGHAPLEGQGPEHRARCLAQLARFDAERGP